MSCSSAAARRAGPRSSSSPRRAATAPAISTTSSRVLAGVAVALDQRARQRVDDVGLCPARRRRPRRRGRRRSRARRRRRARGRAPPAAAVIRPLERSGRGGAAAMPTETVRRPHRADARRSSSRRTRSQQVCGAGQRRCRARARSRTRRRRCGRGRRRARVRPRSALATARSSASPATWPWRPLTARKPSMSSRTSETGRPWRRARSSSVSASPRKALRVEQAGDGVACAAVGALALRAARSARLGSRASSARRSS